MVNLIGDKLNASFSSEVVQGAHVGVAESGAGWVVRRIYEDELGFRIDEAHHLMYVYLERIFTPHAIRSNIESKRFGHQLVWRKAGERNDHIGARLSCSEEDIRQSFGRTGQDHDVLHRNRLHLCDGIAETASTSRPRIHDVGIQPALQAARTRELQQLPRFPNGPGTSAQVEFDRRLRVSIEPLFKKKWFQFHGPSAQTSCVY